LLLARFADGLLVVIVLAHDVVRAAGAGPAALSCVVIAESAAMGIACVVTVESWLMFFRFGERTFGKGGVAIRSMSSRASSEGSGWAG
jgi:hypothetical protein